MKSRVVVWGRRWLGVVNNVQPHFEIKGGGLEGGGGWGLLITFNPILYVFLSSSLLVCFQDILSVICSIISFLLFLIVLECFYHFFFVRFFFFSSLFFYGFH